jgi:hypothetical protein
VLFTDADGVGREIDFIDEPLGLRGQDVRDTAVLVKLPPDGPAPAAKVWIMLPERCMESRVRGDGECGPPTKGTDDQCRAALSAR